MRITSGMRNGRRYLPLLLVVGLAAPATAEAAPRPATPDLLATAERRAEISSDRANLYLAYALGDPARLPAQYRSNAPWDGTLPLLRLRREVRAMPRGRARERIEDTISAQHAVTSCDTNATPLTSSVDSTFFHIDYATIGGGLDVNDYAASLDRSWSTEVASFDWAAPPVRPSNPPPGNRYHVRVEPLGPGLYGFVSSAGTHAGFVGDNPNTSWDDGDALASCMVLNNDYTSFGDPQAALDATTAHEFNHSIQYGYGAAQGPNTPDDIFFEGGATWMEDEVHDAANDNYNYLWPAFADSMGDYDDPSPYPYWIAFRGLTERYDVGVAGGSEQVMQAFWEATSRNTANTLTAINLALGGKGTTLADAFHAYAIAVKYNRACGGGYVAPFCFEEGPAYVAAAGITPVDGTVGSVGSSATASIEDNYSLGWIALPTSGTYDVLVENLGAGGSMRATVACDNGTSLTLMALPAAAGAGGSSTLVSFSPAGCTAPVAIVSNQAQTAANPASSASRQFRVSALAPAGTDRPLSVSRAGSGIGTVTSGAAGIACGTDCTEQYADGSAVTLSAAPAAGSTFEGWIGDCTGTGACALTMSAGHSVTAVFDSPPVDPGGNNNPGTGNGGGTGGGTTGGPARDVVAPSFTRLRLSARRFRAARSGPSVAARVGSRVRFRLSEPARVGFRVERRVAGRRAGGRCRAATRRNRSRPRCVRWVRVRGRFSVNAAAGRRSFRFRGRVGRRTLRRGAYRLVGFARDGAGNRSGTRRARFRIVRR